MERSHVQAVLGEVERIPRVGEYLGVGGFIGELSTGYRGFRAKLVRMEGTMSKKGEDKGMTRRWEKKGSEPSSLRSCEALYLELLPRWRDGSEIKSVYKYRCRLLLLLHHCAVASVIG